MDQPEYSDGLLTDEPLGEEAAVTLPPEVFIAWAIETPNIATDLEADKLTLIAQQCLADHEMDKESMSEWRKQMDRGIELATLVKKEKSYPFDGAANIRYPLITSAALQFNARAYPAIVADDKVVKAKVWGKDPQGMKAARAERVSSYMSFQLSSRVPEWEPETDKLLAVLPIVGAAQRKWWFDPVQGRARCRLIDPGKLIVNAKVKDMTDAPRVTEEIPLYPTEIKSRILSGQFREFEYTDDAEDKQGPQDFIEQHTRLDLDEDGYEEPYIVTVHCDTQTVVRIVADYAEQDVKYKTETVTEPVESIDPVTMMPTVQMVQRQVNTGILSITRGTYFVDFSFMPAMDGGLQGTGLGLLLGDISEAINSIINMLIDAGHFASLGGGFIGSEIRIKGGSQRMRPGEWKLIPGTGNDMRSAMVPVTFPGPDATLFQMLGLLIDAGREIASVKDIMTGDTGTKNMTATTTMALIEQGMMVFTAAYKRIFRSLKREYQLVAGLNAKYLNAEEYTKFLDEQADPAADFDLSDMDIEPVADPRSVTRMQEMATAQLVMQMAEQGLVDRGEAMRRVAQAASIPDTEALMPKPDPMQMKMMEMQAATAEAALMQARVEVELTLAKIESERAGAMKDMADAQAQAHGMRLDEMRIALEARRDAMDRLLRSTGGMAGKPGHAAHAGNGPQGFGPTQGGPVAGFLGGQAGPGGQPAGAFGM